jgi:hypothetical protein
MSNAGEYLNLTCKACFTTWKVRRTSPSTKYTNNLYTPCCGVSGVPSQLAQEEHWLEVTAQHYGYPVDIFEMFYNSWAQTPNAPNLKSYIKQQIVELLSGQ